MSEQESVTGESGLIIIEPSADGETDSGSQTVDTSDEVGALSVHYRDGRPVIIVTGGRALPGEVVVENADGKIVAAYRAGEAQQAGAQTRNETTEVKFYLYTLDNPNV